MTCTEKLLPGQLKGEREKIISDDEITFIRKTVNATVKIPMDISIYFTMFTNPEKLEHQYLLDLSVLTATASRIPLASGWTRNCNLWPCQ